MSIAKRFSVGSMKSEFGNPFILNFNDFLWLAIFEIFQICTKHARLERVYPYVSLFGTFASNRPFICNRHHHQRIKQ